MYVCRGLYILIIEGEKKKEKKKEKKLEFVLKSILRILCQMCVEDFEIGFFFNV